jgi:Protein of unknown function (DUF1194)
MLRADAGLSMRGNIFGLVVALVFGVLVLPGSARATTEVDLALVLAVDISNSMDLEEQELQRSGFVEAFRSPLVHEAIRGGTLGRIAVTYMEWAGTGRQTVVVSWMTIEGAEGAVEFAEQLARAPIQRGPRTSISGAIDFGVKLLDESGVEPLRRVIDVSGDGANNQGRPVTLAREAALARDITINGLPIMLKRANSFWDVAKLDVYYRDCVIGGPGAFMIPVRERQHFAEAIKTKIIREIAAVDPGSRVVPVQAEGPADCLAGELRDWDMRR